MEDQTLESLSLKCDRTSSKQSEIKVEIEAESLDLPGDLTLKAAPRGTVCVITAPVFPAIAAWATFLLTKEVKGLDSGLTATLLLDMVNPKVLVGYVYEYLDVYGVYGVTLMTGSQG